MSTNGSSTAQRPHVVCRLCHSSLIIRHAKWIPILFVFSCLGCFVSRSEACQIADGDSCKPLHFTIPPKRSSSLNSPRMFRKRHQMMSPETATKVTPRLFLAHIDDLSTYTLFRTTDPHIQFHHPNTLPIYRRPHKLISSLNQAHTPPTPSFPPPARPHSLSQTLSHIFPDSLSQRHLQRCSSTRIHTR